MKWSRAPLVSLALSVLLLLSLSCKDRTSSHSTATSDAAATSRAPATLSVFAAASLTDVFPELAREFEQTRPGLKVKMNFAGSQVLRLQIEQGAEFQLFASANKEHLEQLAAKNLVQDQREFAKNRLVVIVPSDGSQGLESFLDITRATHIVVAEESVPLGAYTLQFLAHTSEKPEHHDFAETVKKRIVSRESNARLVRAKVELGEADAAIVYESDAIHSHKVRAIPIPDEFNVEARYFVGTSTSKSPETGPFLDFLRSPTAARILAKHGFRAAQAEAQSHGHNKLGQQP